MRLLDIPGGGLERARAFCVILHGARDSWKQQSFSLLHRQQQKFHTLGVFLNGWYDLYAITYAFSRQIYRTNHTRCARGMQSGSMEYQLC